jgi:hypothetical protein
MYQTEREKIDLKTGKNEIVPTEEWRSAFGVQKDEFAEGLQSALASKFERELAHVEQPEEGH